MGKTAGASFGGMIVGTEEPVRSETKSGLRLAGIDRLRGLCMLLMSLDHSIWFLTRSRHPDELWGGPFPDFGTPLVFLSRLIPSLSTCGFFFLMGVSMPLFQASREKSGWTSREILFFFLKRGLIFIPIQILIENPLWALHYTGKLSESFGYFGVLYSLGASMMICACFLNLSPLKLLVLSIVGIAASEWLMPGTEAFYQSYGIVSRLLLVAGNEPQYSVYFPLFPWVFTALLGIVFGKNIGTGDAFQKLKKISVALLLAFVAVRFFTPWGNLRSMEGRTGWMSYFTLTKYPPSLLYLLLAGGANGLMLCLLQKISKSLFTQPLEILGKAPFFFYFAHLVLFGIIGRMVGAPGLSLLQFYPLWLAVVLLLLPPTWWYGKFKSRQSQTSLWRLF